MKKISSEITTRGFFDFADWLPCSGGKKIARTLLAMAQLDVAMLNLSGAYYCDLRVCAAKRREFGYLDGFK